MNFFAVFIITNQQQTDLYTQYTCNVNIPQPSTYLLMKVTTWAGLAVIQKKFACHFHNFKMSMFIPNKGHTSYQERFQKHCDITKLG